MEKRCDWVGCAMAALYAVLAVEEDEAGRFRQDEGGGEEEADGEDGGQEHSACDLDVLDAVEQMRRALQYTSPESLSKRSHEKPVQVQVSLLTEKMRCQVTRKTGNLNSSELKT